MVLSTHLMKLAGLSALIVHVSVCRHVPEVSDVSELEFEAVLNSLTLVLGTGLGLALLVSS